jgi:UDP-glucuronate 4-epimerase
MQTGAVVRTYADITKARHLFGYDPHTEFEKGVKRFLEWLNDHPS